MGLATKYFELDLDAEMMQKDLLDLGIKIDAQHFDMIKSTQFAEKIEKAQV